jgi:DUF4097 and DUF4098 domain-containing protein YvlB
VFSFSRLLICPALSLGLTACIDFADFGNSEQYKEDFHYTYPLNPGGSVSLENANGSVEISGWDQNNVEVDGTKYASTKDLLDSTKVVTSGTSGSVRIRTERPEMHHGNSGARYTIRVPKKVLLDTIATTNGSIRVSDVEGTTRLRSTNGTLRMTNIHGDVEAHTTNGSIEAQHVDGSCNLHSTNGHIRTEAAHGSFEAQTTNGSISADLTDPIPNWPVKTETRNGHIELKVRAQKLPDVRAETTNSSITLEIPADANARVRAHTTHANITSDFGISGDNSGRTRSEFEGNIGSGGPLIELSSRNGSIKVLKL